MASGILGLNPGSTAMDRGTQALVHNRPPGTLCATRPSSVDIEQYAKGVVHRLSTSLGSADVQRAVFALLGEQSFSAGVIYGMTKGLVVGIYQLGVLFKTLALAEYDDLRHAGTFWERVRRGAALGNLSTVAIAGELAAVSYFWPRIDRLAAEAAEERNALYAGIKQACMHPGDTLDKAWDGLVAKYHAFVKLAGEGTLSGNFGAGVLFGEVLLDVLLIADGVTALARIATRIPSLLRMLPKLEEVAPALREAVKASRERLASPKAPPPPLVPRKPAARVAAPAPVAPPVAPPVSASPLSAAVAAPIDYKTMSGPYTLASGEERAVTFDQFANHVSASGLDGAFTKPLPEIYDQVYAVPKLDRPLPETYLSPDFMDAHEGLFADGAARVETVDSFNQYNKLSADAGLPFGRDDGVFMAPGKLVDDLHATGDSGLMETTLGFDTGTFSGAGSMSRTVIDDPSLLNLRFATGQESGANKFWVPGGYTFKVDGGAGVPEMLVDKIPSPLVDPNVKVFQ